MAFQIAPHLIHTTRRDLLNNHPVSTIRIRNVGQYLIVILRCPDRTLVRMCQNIGQGSSRIVPFYLHALLTILLYIVL